MIRVRQYLIDFENARLFFLSNIIILCKTIILIGLSITFFSEHWAINPTSSDIYAGYKKRCTVHICTTIDMDPVWLIDLASFLALINFKIEFLITILVYCFLNKASKLIIALEGLVFLLTFILTDCLIIFGIYIIIYTYGLPMSYAYNCFIVSVGFSIIDWGFSLRRLITNWPEIIYLSDNELLLYNYPVTRLVRTNYTRPRLYATSSSNSITIKIASV